MVLAHNTSGTPQQIGGVWIPPKEGRDVPLDVALIFKNVPEISYDWATEDTVPSFTDGRLTGMTYMTPLSVFDGYGGAGVLVVRELLRRGIDLDLYSVGWLIERDLDPALLERLDRPKKIYDVALVKGPPDENVPQLIGKAKISHAMWESTPLPPGWVPTLNRLPLAIVPTTEQVRIYRDSGVTCPVEVVPDAIDTTFWSQRPEQPPEDRFTVVSWGKMSSRKMPIELLQVFSTAFPHDRYPECRLEIKTHGGILGGGAHLIPSIADPRVTIHDDVWSTDELRSWVARAHCAACLSRGEGMYLPPLQAMALGVPTVVVDHTGPHDFADERWNWPVRLDEREPLVPSPMGGGMRWWNPDLEHAVAQLRAVYDDYARARERAKHGRRLVLRRYNPQAVVDRFLDALKVLA